MKTRIFAAVLAAVALGACADVTAPDAIPEPSANTVSTVTVSIASTANTQVSAWFGKNMIDPANGAFSLEYYLTPDMVDPATVVLSNKEWANVAVMPMSSAAIWSDGTTVPQFRFLSDLQSDLNPRSRRGIQVDSISVVYMRVVAYQYDDQGHYVKTLPEITHEKVFHVGSRSAALLTLPAVKNVQYNVWATQALRVRCLFPDSLSIRGKDGITTSAEGASGSFTSKYKVGEITIRGNTYSSEIAAQKALLAIEK